MKNAIVVFVTVPGKNAEALAKRLLKARVCACVNIIPRLLSYYWWNARLEEGKEALLIIKTQAVLFSPLKKLLTQLHPYTVPEIVGIPIEKIHTPYLEWILKETAPPRRRLRPGSPGRKKTKQEERRRRI